MDNQIVVSDYAQMDRVLREERAYILNLVKQVKKSGCNVLLIQKSILRYTPSPHTHTTTNARARTRIPPNTRHQQSILRYTRMT
jgi:hypothetical protein